MSQIRFNQAYVALVTAGVASMFFVPPSVTNRAKGKEEMLLLPVVKPVRAIASMFARRYGEKPLPAGEARPRTDSELSTENAELRQQVAFLTRQVEELQFINAQRKRLGPLRNYVTAVGVIGGDATPGRESLSLMPTSAGDVSQDAPVMTPDGAIAGTIQGNRVRLITDKTSRLSGSFGRWEGGKWTPVATSLKASVAGAGGGRMHIEHLTLSEVTALKPGDWVVLAEIDGPHASMMLNRLIGQIESIGPLPGKPQFALIVVRPNEDLARLREVMVLKK
jgi:hypothetical protein